ncbi:MAG: hypothetical protein FWC73_13255 [Defluviitaleaceae bacterium]|nr:hypothetical protein [Defluviitaleaceae bacterium]
MSDIFMAYLVMENEIDAGFIDKTFNLQQDPYGDICPTGDNAVTPYLFYYGLISIGCEEKSNKYCYAIENGQNLFARLKYAYYDIRNNLYLSRNGYAINNEGPLGSALTPEEHQELFRMDTPPVDELKTLFTYILSSNQQFYIFFSYQDVDVKVKDHKQHLENILNDKELWECTSECAQARLVKLFADNQFTDGINAVMKVTGTL